MIKSTVKASQNPPLSKSETAQLRWEIYLQNRKLKKLSQLVESVLLLPTQNKQLWAQKFSPELDQVMSELLEESSQLFDGVSLDPSLVNMYAEFVTNLKDVSIQVESIINIYDPIKA